jgi:hypothetical protein
MTWQNLPCPATLPAVSQLCPDGWLEVFIEHVPARSVPGGGDAQDAESIPHLARTWGLDGDAIERVDEMLGDLYSFDFEEMYKVPNGATALFKVLIKPADETSEGLPEGLPGYSITALWGVGGAPVYTLDEEPSLTGQQQAPQPGRGDMWASVIERYDGQINPALVDIFRARREQGLAKYGVPLQAGNGRDICKDLADETLDRIVYAEQAAQERPEFADIMRGMQARDISHARRARALGDGAARADRRRRPVEPAPQPGAGGAPAAPSGARQRGLADGDGCGDGRHWHAGSGGRAGGVRWRRPRAASASPRPGRCATAAAGRARRSSAGRRSVAGSTTRTPSRSRSWSLPTIA